MKREKLNTFIIDHLSMVCYISDMETYEMLFLSDPGLRMFGLQSEKDYLGRKCYEILQGRNSPCPYCTNAKLVRGEKYCWEHFNETLKRSASIEDSIIEIDGREYRLEVVHDFFLQKDEIMRLSKKLTSEQALLECVSALSEGTEISQAVNRFLEVVGRFYQAARSYIFEFDTDKKVADNTFEWCSEGVTSQIDNLKGLSLDLLSDWIDKFEKTGEFFISSLYDEMDPKGEDFRILEAQNIRSLMAVPFFKEGKVTGFFGVDDPSSNLENRTLMHSASKFIWQEMEKRRLIEQLAYASYTDMLTGLKNRNCFKDTVMRLRKEKFANMGVVYLDLDNLKETNDTLGHDLGDKYLIETAKVLTDVFPNIDIFRTGGDEFVLFLPDWGKEKTEGKMRQLSEHIQTQNLPCSVGSCYDDKGVRLETLMVRAEKEMYRQKEEHHSKNGFFCRYGSGIKE